MNDQRLDSLVRAKADLQRKYEARQAHIPVLEKEFKDNLANGKISMTTFEIAKAQLAKYKEDTQKEFDEIAVTQQKIEEEIHAVGE